MLYGPKFKSSDIARLQPFVRLNQDICEEDEKIVAENLEDRQALSQYSLSCECLALSRANEKPLLVWTRAVEDSNTTNQKRFQCHVQHIATWFSSRCDL